MIAQNQTSLNLCDIHRFAIVRDFNKQTYYIGVLLYMIGYRNIPSFQLLHLVSLYKNPEKESHRNEV